MSWFPWRSITWRPHPSGTKEGRDERRLSDAINTSSSGIVKILIYRSRIAKEFSDEHKTVQTIANDGRTLIRILGYIVQKNMP